MLFKSRVPTYLLTAVVMHHGARSNVGHYTALCLHQNDWFKLDDTRVLKVPTEEVLSAKNEAYLLFYSKIS